MLLYSTVACVRICTPGVSAEDAEERQRVIDLGRDGVLADTLIDAALTDGGSVPVTEHQPDAGSIGGFLANSAGSSGFSVRNIPTYTSMSM